MFAFNKSTYLSIIFQFSLLSFIDRMHFEAMSAFIRFIIKKKNFIFRSEFVSVKKAIVTDNILNLETVEGVSKKNLNHEKTGN